MKRNPASVFFTCGAILVACGVLLAQEVGDTPAIAVHMKEADIESGRVSFDETIQHGEKLFLAVYNRLDGFGRPATTADGKPRANTQAGMLRITGPDAHSCVSCHNRPRPGGGGDFATDVFALSDSKATVKDSINPEFVNERMPVSLFGAGPVEMLAREMTQELHGIRMGAINHAYLCSCNVPAHLATKGIDFGDIVAHGDGTVDTRKVVGVSADLVVRPFHQNGAAVSIRQFTNEGMNQHLGLQSQELFGIDTDPDADGVMNEMTVGDITAIALFEAQLALPGRQLPADPVRRKAAGEGEALFSSVGCTECHVPAMKLRTRIFTEANPFNPEWKLPYTVTKPVGFDMTVQGETPRLEPTPDGGAVVRAYTDLKRHNICDDSDRFFCNERVAEPGIPAGSFLTRKLWDIGSSAAFGHRGDLSTISEAIEHHAGEASATKTRYLELSAYQRGAIVEFLKTLQVLPAK